MADAQIVGWAKFDIVVKAVAGILLPVVIFAIGVRYTFVQQRSADAQRNADRAASLIKSLSSDNKRERSLALGLIQNLDQNQMTDEIKKAFVTAGLTEDDPKLAPGATAAVSNALKNDPKLAETVQQVVRSNPNSVSSTNPQLNQTLANIALNGQGEDRKMASDTLKSLNNNALDLRGHDKQLVKVQVKAKGTSLGVNYSLNGNGGPVLGDSFSFTLDKARNNPNILALLMSFSNSTGGEYEITVRDAKTDTIVSTYTVKQSDQMPIAISYTFEIA